MLSALVWVLEFAENTQEKAYNYANTVADKLEKSEHKSSILFGGGIILFMVVVFGFAIFGKS